MAKTPSTRKRTQPESKAPVLNLVPKLPCSEVSLAAEKIKMLADRGEGIGIGFVLLVPGKAPIVNSFGIEPEQRYQTIGALMQLIRHLQDWKK